MKKILLDLPDSMLRDLNHLSKSFGMTRPGLLRVILDRSLADIKANGLLLKPNALPPDAIDGEDFDAEDAAAMLEEE